MLKFVSAQKATPAKSAAEARRAAGYTFVFTSLPDSVPAASVLELYRARWPVELAFKRLKSLLGLDRLKNQDPVAARAWITAKLLVALLIPILAIVLDAPAMRHLLERRFGDQTATQDLKELTGRVAQLEDDLEDLGRSVQTLKDETQFLQRLIEDGEQGPSQRLPPPS